MGFNFLAEGLQPLPDADADRTRSQYYVHEGEVVQWNGTETISALDAVIEKAAGESSEKPGEPRRSEVEEMVAPTVAGWNNVNIIGCNDSEDDAHDSTTYYSFCHRTTMRGM